LGNRGASSEYDPHGFPVSHRLGEYRKSSVARWIGERGILVSYETVRRWVNHFGSKIAADLRKRRPKPQPTGISTKSI
jgi:transposase-like protein